MGGLGRRRPAAGGDRMQTGLMGQAHRPRKRQNPPRFLSGQARELRPAIQVANRIGRGEQRLDLRRSADVPTVPLEQRHVLRPEPVRRQRAHRLAPHGALVRGQATRRRYSRLLRRFWHQCGDAQRRHSYWSAFFHRSKSLKFLERKAHRRFPVIELGEFARAIRCRANSRCLKPARERLTAAPVAPSESVLIASPLPIPSCAIKHLREAR